MSPTGPSGQHQGGARMTRMGSRPKFESAAKQPPQRATHLSSPLLVPDDSPPSSAYGTPQELPSSPSRGSLAASLRARLASALAVGFLTTLARSWRLAEPISPPTEPEVTRGGGRGRVAAIA